MPTDLTDTELDAIDARAKAAGFTAESDGSTRISIRQLLGLVAALRDHGLSLSIAKEQVAAFRAGLAGEPEPRGMTEAGLDAFIRADKVYRERWELLAELDAARAALATAMILPTDTASVADDVRELAAQRDAAKADRDRLARENEALRALVRRALPLIATAVGEHWTADADDLVRELARIDAEVKP